MSSFTPTQRLTLIYELYEKFNILAYSHWFVAASLPFW